MVSAETIKALFRAADVSASGFISKVGLQSVLKQLDCDLSDCDVERLTSVVAAGGDVPYEAFIDWVTRTLPGVDAEIAETDLPSESAASSSPAEASAAPDPCRLATVEGHAADRANASVELPTELQVQDASLESTHADPQTRVLPSKPASETDQQMCLRTLLSALQSSDRVSVDTITGPFHTGGEVPVAFFQFRMSQFSCKVYLAPGAEDEGSQHVKFQTVFEDNLNTLGEEQRYFVANEWNSTKRYTRLRCGSAGTRDIFTLEYDALVPTEMPHSIGFALLLLTLRMFYTSMVACVMHICDRRDIPFATHSMIQANTLEVTVGDTTRVEQCPICLEMFKAGERARRLPCLHLFHTGDESHCNVDKHLVCDKKCPVCKTPIDVMQSCKEGRQGGTTHKTDSTVLATLSPVAVNRVSEDPSAVGASEIGMPQAVAQAAALEREVRSLQARWIQIQDVVSGMQQMLQFIDEGRANVASRDPHDVDPSHLQVAALDDSREPAPDVVTTVSIAAASGDLVFGPGKLPRATLVGDLKFHFLPGVAKTLLLEGRVLDDHESLATLPEELFLTVVVQLPLPARLEAIHVPESGEMVARGRASLLLEASGTAMCFTLSHVTADCGGAGRALSSVWRGCATRSAEGRTVTFHAQRLVTTPDVSDFVPEPTCCTEQELDETWVGQINVSIVGGMCATEILIPCWRSQRDLRLVLDTFPATGSHV